MKKCLRCGNTKIIIWGDGIHNLNVNDCFGCNFTMARNICNDKLFYELRAFNKQPHFKRHYIEIPQGTLLILN